MKRRAHWLAGAGIVMTLAAGRAVAGDAGDALTTAEQRLAAGQPDEAWEAFEGAAEVFWAEAPLTFRTATLADDVTGFGQYRPVTGSYHVGDMIDVYLEPVGYGWTPLGDEYRIRFTTALAIETSTGVVLTENAQFATLEQTARSRSREFMASVTFAVPDLRPGDYVAALTLQDAATGKSATADIAFTVTP